MSRTRRHNPPRITRKEVELELMQLEHGCRFDDDSANFFWRRSKVWAAWIQYSELPSDARLDKLRRVIAWAHGRNG